MYFCLFFEGFGEYLFSSLVYVVFCGNMLSVKYIIEQDQSHFQKLYVASAPPSTTKNRRAVRLVWNNSGASQTKS